jgi:lysophospholipid acyltransferase (LPLAT)-like uncharacterized protein
LKYRRLKNKILGHVAYYVGLILKWSLRIRIQASPDYDPYQQYLFAFWHGKQLLPVLSLTTHRGLRAVLVSPSKDGDILSVCLKHLGYEIIRGSSRDRNISALAEMMRKLKAGYSLGFGVDGPIGPIYKVKPGMTHMAQKFSIPIIPVGSAFSKQWILEKAWDRYAIPKPFSKTLLYLGEPFYIKAEDDLENSNRVLEQKIEQAQTEALRLLIQ